MTRCIVCKKILPLNGVRGNCGCGYQWCAEHPMEYVEPILARLHERC
jgi:hypothetical protein